MRCPSPSRWWRGSGSSSSVTLVGHFLGASEGKALFAADLAESVAFGDARYREFRDRVVNLCAARRLPVPDMPDPPTFDGGAPVAIELARIGAVIFTSGFRPDYSRWIHLQTFDEFGFPLQEEGASSTVRGMYFCGVHYLRKRKSSLLIGVGEDAGIVARTLADRRVTRSGE